MTCNLGGAERTIRFVLGIILVGIGYFAPVSSLVSTLLYVVGAIMIVTAAVGFCPAWKLVGINTCAQTVTMKP
jgi:hypothetical protein